jgi:hypothetical protein
MGSEDREAVTTMTTKLTWRPSALTAVCTSATPAIAAQAHVLGRPAVSIRVRTAPTFGLLPATAGALKINNYIGTAAAAPATRIAGEGATTSLIQTVSAAQYKNVQYKNVRNEKVQSEMVKGGDARGIPPRGTPV